MGCSNMGIEDFSNLGNSSTNADNDGFCKLEIMHFHNMQIIDLHILENLFILFIYFSFIEKQIIIAFQNITNIIRALCS